MLYYGFGRLILFSKSISAPLAQTDAMAETSSFDRDLTRPLLDLVRNPNRAEFFRPHIYPEIAAVNLGDAFIPGKLD